MSQTAEGRYFHPRLTNLGGGDFCAALPLPSIPAELDEEEVKTFPQPFPPPHPKP
jgi:hypothetical protein